MLTFILIVVLILALAGSFAVHPLLLILAVAAALWLLVNWHPWRGSQPPP